ncbi:MAG: aminotransferase class I/II-fold pyridoxal phosphate-dependent enzyme [Veillonella sp.]|nr:aminotransferase class I/II-fold pyridoxal phosphate-dependent enzyme [Veillonella sp.]
MGPGKDPILSPYMMNRIPSGIRLGQIKFLAREERPHLVNGAIGNVMMPMYPAMQDRLFNLGGPNSPFRTGIVPYMATAGTPEAQEAFRVILKSQGFKADHLNVLVTDGASMAMEISMLGVCGGAGKDDRPLLMLDPTYTNYAAVGARIGRKTVTIQRTLSDDGHFELPSTEEVERKIQEEKPGAMLIIPYDNPTGQLFTYETLKEYAKLCVKYNMWMISDEAYRELAYEKGQVSTSVWGLSDEDVPGIEGRRISLETASKVWNACGLRIGAIITDNDLCYEKFVAEYTSNLSANTLGQYIFGALAHESFESLREWYEKQRDYYREMIFKLHQELQAVEPDFIISNPQASIYFVIDVRKVAKPGFDCEDFAIYCAEKGHVMIDGQEYTLLIAPMKGFYGGASDEDNPGRTQLRLSFCENPEVLRLAPELLSRLFREYEAQRDDS